MNLHQPLPDADLAVEAERFRASGALGRSDLMVRLFDFLLERSLAGDVPKEVEVAQDVFGKDAGFDAVQDASVRVTIFRLRRKLDEYYAATPGDRNRLFIPRGEYRLSVAPADAVPPIPPEEEEALAEPAARRLPAGWLWVGLAALLLLVSAAGWWWVLEKDRDPGLAALDTPPWSSFDSSRWPMFVVVGDYYIFGEADAAGGLSRLVREFSINSREDLDQYLMLHPEQMDRYVNLDLQYLPTGAASALASVLPLARKAGASAAGPLRVITSSALTPGMIKGVNIVYVGYLSGLGLLREPVFGASNFEVGASYDELIDRRTRKRYLSDWSRVVDGRSASRDYAYIASIPAPSGNRIMVVSGTRDAALRQAAEIAADPAELKKIVDKVGDRPFEALFEVQTLGSADLGSRLVAAYPVEPAKLWQTDNAPPERFPDDLSAAH